MKYDFRLIPEAARAGTFALIVFGATLLVDLDVDAIWSDWEAYLRSGLAGAGAAVGAAILAVLTRGN